MNKYEYPKDHQIGLCIFNKCKCEKCIKECCKNDKNISELQRDVE